MNPSAPLITLLLLSALLSPSPAGAYTQPAATFSAGGGETSSGNYTNLGVIGQPGIIGASTSGAYTATHGFLAVLGDGFKILYPLIAASPGTLTFSLAAGANDSQPFAIANNGGSALAWTVTKGDDPGNIFGFTPTAGVNAGSVTVTANAAALAPGSYHTTLTIGGAGITQTVDIQLDLTVTASLYTLSVTLKQDIPGKGGGTVTSTAPDSRLTCNNSGSSADVLCSANFPAGSTVTLAQAPDSNSTWAAWSPAGCGSNNPSCQVVLNAPQSISATFPYSAMAKVVSTGGGFESLAQAYADAAVVDTIKARSVLFPAGDLNLTSGKSITLLGGLDAYYAPHSGHYTTLTGKLIITSGRLTLDSLVIR